MRKVQNFIHAEYPYSARVNWHNYTSAVKNKRRAYVRKKYRRPLVVVFDKGMTVDGYYMEHLEW